MIYGDGRSCYTGKYAFKIESGFFAYPNESEAQKPACFQERHQAEAFHFTACN